MLKDTTWTQNLLRWNAHFCKSINTLKGKISLSFSFKHFRELSCMDKTTRTTTNCNSAVFMLFQHLCSLSLFPLFLVSSVLEISILSAKTKNALLMIICIIFRVNKSVKCIIQLNTRENLFDPNTQWLSPIMKMVS